jgi:hypothetical protein
MGIVPWPELAFSIQEARVTSETLNAIFTSTPDHALELKRQLIAQHADDLSWTSKASRVFSNILLTAQRTCMPPQS